MPASSAPLLEREPVRVFAIVAGLLTATGQTLVAIGQHVDPLIAIGTALLSLAVIVGGGEVARSKAVAPATYDRDVDAEAVIGYLEARG